MKKRLSLGCSEDKLQIDNYSVQYVMGHVCMIYLWNVFFFSSSFCVCVLLIEEAGSLQSAQHETGTTAFMK